MQPTTFKTVLLVILVMALTLGVLFLLNYVQDSRWFDPNKRPPTSMPH